MLKKILTCPAICILNRDEKGLFFSAHFIFNFAGPERVSVAYQSAGAGGLRMGWRMMVPREGGAGWESLVKFELIRLLPSLQLIIH